MPGRARYVMMLMHVTHKGGTQVKGKKNYIKAEIKKQNTDGVLPVHTSFLTPLS